MLKPWGLTSACTSSVLSPAAILLAVGGSGHRDGQKGSSEGGQERGVLKVRVSR